MICHRSPNPLAILITGMPASTARDIHPLFRQAFNSGSLADLLALYEDHACFVTSDGSFVKNRAALRGTLEQFPGMKGHRERETGSVWESGDGELALLSGRWILNGTGPDGAPIRMTGTSHEVARRGRDGSWCYVIDDPGVGR